MEKHLKSKVTINRLCYKGLDVFAQKGYHNTNLNDILRELCLSTGAFYHHFKSKEDFFVYIVQNLVAQKIYALLVEPLSAQEDPLSAIMESLNKALEPGKSNELIYGFMLGDFLTELDGKQEQISAYLKDILQMWEVNMIGMLKKGKLDGHIARHIDCEGVAAYIISSYLGMRTMMMNHNPKQAKYQYLQQLRHYFNSLRPTAIRA